MLGASVTNAITEALTGVAKVTNRLGRGYCFLVVRAKMMYAKRSLGLSTSYRRAIATMPYNQDIEQQDATVMEMDGQRHHLTGIHLIVTMMLLGS